jgi:GntR family transcriptional regulator
MGFRLFLDRESQTPPYMQILEQLRAAIYAQAVTAGERLPSVRQMAAQLRVNPLTVARALNELEAESLIEKRWGSGTFVLRVKAKHRERSRLAALRKAAQAFAVRTGQLGFGLGDAVAALHSVPGRDQR